TFSFNSWMNCFHWCRTGSAPVVPGVAGGTWIHRGGLAGEFQMMLPVTNSSELFNQPPPLFPTLKSYTIRPFVQEDKEKYSEPTARDNLTPTQELMMFFRQKSSFPDSLLYHFPSLLQLNVHPQILDSSEARNLVICLMSALKANGSQGVFCELKASNKQALELHVSLGFLELPGAEVSTREAVIFGRLL
ncbi:hypothetical protein scyTo_0015819, partial [Scyliorhinus torazame]|nr:hypothetical protein [Scyliorhinus torazame]